MCFFAPILHFIICHLIPSNYSFLNSPIIKPCLPHTLDGHAAGLPSTSSFHSVNKQVNNHLIKLAKTRSELIRLLRIYQFTEVYHGEEITTPPLLGAERVGTGQVENTTYSVTISCLYHYILCFLAAARQWRMRRSGTCFFRISGEKIKGNFRFTKIIKISITKTTGGTFCIDI